MIARYFAEGLQRARKRPALILGVYGLDVLTAFMASIPVYAALHHAVGASGFSGEGAAHFDVVLWADILEQAGPALRATAAQGLWMAPVALAAKTALYAGVVFALRDGGVRPFWMGLGEYGGRSLLLALLFLLPALGAALLTGAAVALFSAVATGEAAMYRLGLMSLIIPAAGLLVVDMMHDYGRIALVTGDRPIREAWRVGMGWPFRHPAALVLYLGWLLPAGAFTFLPVVLDANTATGGSGAVWFLFAGQQLLLFARAAAMVGWLGSEAAYYEAVRLADMPLLAEATVEPGALAPGEA